MSDSSDEEDFFSRIAAENLFEDSEEQQRKQAEANELLKQYTERSWGLRARQSHVTGNDTDDVRYGKLQLHDGVELIFKEKQGQQAKVWDCALVLAKFLACVEYFNLDYFKGKRVIELGCGIGVPGMAAGALGAAQVVLTDFEEAVPWIRANVEENIKLFAHDTHMQAQCLMWGESDYLDQFKEPFDVILCSDLVYGDETTSKQLATTIQSLSQPNTVIISAHEARFAGDRGSSFFAILLQNHFTIKEVPHEHLDATYQAQSIHVHLITPPQDIDTYF